MNIIYFIRNCLNNKTYIGVTNDLERRFYTHKYCAQKEASSHLHNAMRKYGVENFKIYPLEYIKDRKEAYEREQEWIKDLNLYEGDHGYNMTPGGRGASTGEGHHMYGLTGKDHPGYQEGEDHPMYGKSHTEETKRKISEANAGNRHSKETREKISKVVSGDNNPFYGKEHSEETKKRISRKLSGKVSNFSGKNHDEDTKKKLSSLKSGENNPHSKITKTEAREIKWLAQNSEKSQKTIGNMYHVSAQTVSNIKCNHTWKNINPKNPN